MDAAPEKEADSIAVEDASLSHEEGELVDLCVQQSDGEG